MSTSAYSHFYKWSVDSDIYCSAVYDNPNPNIQIANYYKNGELYADHQRWTKQTSDIEISEIEFNKLISLV